jgi:hypothetical protein
VRLKRRGYKQKAARSKVLCAKGLPHKANEGQKIALALVRTRKARKGKTEDIAFSTFMFEGRGGTTTRVQTKEGRYSLAVRNPVSSEHGPQI